MSKRNFLIDVDLNKNQLLNPVLHNQTSHPGSSPSFTSTGYTYYNTTDHTAYTYAPANGDADGDGWINLGFPEGAGVTNLGYTASPTDGTVTSSTGGDATLPLANVTNAGLLDPTDWAWLNNKTIVGVTGTKAQFNTALTDGDFLFVGDLEDTNTDDYVSSAGFNTGDGDLTLTRLSGGTVTQNLDGRYQLLGTYDNYVSWDLYSDGALRSAITKNENVNFVGGTGISLPYTTTLDNTLTINHTNSIVAGTASGGSGSLTHGGTFTVPTVTYDTEGHVTSTGTTTYTLPSDDDTTNFNIQSNGGTQVNIQATETINFIDTTTISTVVEDAVDPDVSFNVIDDSITYAKIQNAVSNNVLLGNNNGAGTAFEELSVTSVMSMLQLDIDLQTLSLPANTTITTFAQTLLDDTTQGAMQTTLGVDPAGTKNSTDVTLAGTPDYITAGGTDNQTLTLNQIVLTTDVTGELPIANFATKDEDDMVSNSDQHVPTQQSVKAYVDNAVTGALVYQGGYDAGTNTPDLDTNPDSGITQGWTYTVTASGTFFTTLVAIGDLIIAETDSPTVEADWTIVNKAIPDIVDASETAKGIVEEATQLETDAGTAVGGTSARLFVNPAKLNVWSGTTNITTLGTVTTGVWNATNIDDTRIAFTDNTTGDSSITKHGYLPKLNNSSTQFLNGVGNWVTPVDNNDNTTYNHLAVTTTGGALLRLVGVNPSTTDDVKFASGSATTVNYTDANTITFNHSDTSTQVSVNNASRTYIQDVTLDAYGHVTGLVSASETVVDNDTTYDHSAQSTTGGALLRLTASGSGSGDDDVKFADSTAIEVVQTDVNTITINHKDTSSQASIDGGGRTYIQDVTLDEFGHVTGLNTATETVVDTTNFDIQANGGTEVNIEEGENINFINGTDTTAVVTNQVNPTVTFNHNNTTRNDATSTESPAHGADIDVIDSVTTNARGHVTAVNVKTITLPTVPSTSVNKFAQDLTGTTTSHVVTHNLGSRDINVTVYTAASTYDVIDCEIRHTSTNTVTLNFNVAPTSGQYRVVIMG